LPSSSLSPEVVELIARRVVPMIPAVDSALLEHLAAEQAAGRGAVDDLVFVTRARDADDPAKRRRPRC
jgi:hypothetical protein